MAAVGLRTNEEARDERFGRLKVHIAPLAAVSDTNTYNTGLTEIIDGGIFVSPHDASAVAADTIAVASVSGGEITFQVAGTARAANLLVFGF